MKFQDYYQALGVPRDADAAAIKKAYRKLALEWHPDRHQGDKKEAAERRFKELSEAYEVLSDAEKRKKYDRFGANWQQGADFQPDPAQGTMSREEFEAAFGGGGGFSDFFQSMFGREFQGNFRGGERARHGRFRHRGADLHAELALPLSAALRGGKQSFEVPTRASCPTCGGTGELADHVCPTCAGLGAVRSSKRIDLKIPDAVRDRMTLRLAGLGEAGAGGGTNGDLLLELRLLDDANYRLVDGELEARVRLWPWVAHAGGSVDVTTARGTVSLKVPAGTRSGQRQRLRGQGLADGKGGFGDLYARFELDLPAVLDDEQKRLLDELARASGERGGKP